jgi:alpha/beta superfamily hydrolase
MENQVVSSVCEALVKKSIIAFRFNFQGVGHSQGTPGVGPERLDDVKAAISFITTVPEVNPDRVGLAGYSAGAAWGLAAADQDPRIKAYAAISPPLPLFDFDFLRRSRKPKLLITGSLDEHIPLTAFADFCQRLAEPAECAAVEGADHFWQGYEEAAAERAALFFSRVL